MDSIKRVYLLQGILFIFSVLFILDPYPITYDYVSLDTFALLFLFPIVAILIYKGYLFSHVKRSFFSETIFLIGVMVMMFGMGSHYIADAMNLNPVYAGNDPYSRKIYLLDEFFTHQIIGLGAGILMVQIMMNLKDFSCKKIDLKNKIFLSISSIFSLGFIGFYYAVEGQQLILYTVGVLVFLGYLIPYHIRYRVENNPMAYMFFIGMISSLIMIIMWGLYHGGFPQLMTVI